MEQVVPWQGLIALIAKGEGGRQAYPLMGSGDTACRPMLEDGAKAAEPPIMKNLFAFIGLCVVLKKGYELYSEYTELKREQRRQADF